MLDNHKPNVVILTDRTDVLLLSKPLGSHKVACELRAAGYEVTVINHLHVFSFEEIKNILQQTVNEQTLFVGVNSFFYQSIENPIQLDTPDVLDHERGGQRYTEREPGAFLPHGIKYNRQLRELVSDINPQCQWVLGGPDAQDLSYIRDYDYAVIGYGDVAIVNLADHLHKGTPLEKSRRSLFGTTLVDDRAAETYDFNASAMKYQPRDAILPGETLVIEISRGCIFRCGFCSYPLNGKKKLDHIKHEEILRKELIDNYQQFGVTRYLFSDDTFNDSQEKVEMIHRVSKSLPFDLEFWAFARLDLLAAHPHTIDMLFDSGCRGCFFGIETLDPATAKLIGKGGSRQKLIDTLRICKEKYGDRILLHGTFIFGLPGEEISSMERTAQALLNKDIPLDSWVVLPFYLSQQNLAYTSEFDRYPEKYGYEITGTQDNNRYLWKNQFTTFEECKRMADEVMAQGIRDGNRKVSNLAAFEIAGLGFDLDFALNKPMKDFDWHSVDVRKQQRAIEYKELLHQRLGIMPLTTNE
jgi:radical SAM superfamily enzyme YgiQ (UPF0313 family)